MSAEKNRLDQHYTGEKNWLKWGPYLSERQWGTVREDYSPDGSAWNYFPHDHARSRVYRWGEDGLAGISDNLQRICLSIALWNGKDPILKERMFGLTGPEGNHGEDCKELYYYLDNTPTHSYMKHVYKYPQAEFPYGDLVNINASRSKQDFEYELVDTGIFNNDQYFDVVSEYAKADDEDLLLKITVFNRGKEDADITVLPQIWFRNLWDYGIMNKKPVLSLDNGNKGFDIVKLDHDQLGEYYYHFQEADDLVFTDNESNTQKLWGQPNKTPFVKDLFHKIVLTGNYKEFAFRRHGTKFSPVYKRTIRANGSAEIRVRLSKLRYSENPLIQNFEEVFTNRTQETDAFYQSLIHGNCNEDERNIQRQAFSGMLWSKQYFNIDIPRWLNGDPGQPAPPEKRKSGRNHEWNTLNNEDIISMPDKWEYPWYAAWDLAFHCEPLAMLDARFAKQQLLLFLREWYMHPNGQIPAYEWAFGDVNPPVHAMSCLKVYYLDKQINGNGDIDFLKKAFTKLSLNFTWWVNRKDSRGKNVFEGGFLGLDNIGVFDRSSAIPGGGHLEQADGTSWMAMYCLNMLEMALEITMYDKSFEPMTTKFFEHFALIAESLNRIGKNWTGSWDEQEGFFYDVLALPDKDHIPLKVRSLVGLTTLFATFCIRQEWLDAAPEFRFRMQWFNDYFKDQSDYTVIEDWKDNKVLLALIPKDRLKRLLKAMLDESEFLGEFGIRSVSKKHEHGYGVFIEGQFFGLHYEPAESSTSLFGGNSNWRGPIWMPMNYMLIQSLRRFYEFFGDEFKVEYPTGSGFEMNLEEVSVELSKRLIRIFAKDENGNRPVNGLYSKLYQNEHFSDLVLFYEYFHGDNGRGVGATHQTGWTGVITDLIHSIKIKG